MNALLIQRCANGLMVSEFKTESQVHVTEIFVFQDVTSPHSMSASAMTKHIIEAFSVPVAPTVRAEVEAVREALGEALPTILTAADAEIV